MQNITRHIIKMRRLLSATAMLLPVAGCATSAQLRATAIADTPSRIDRRAKQCSVFAVVKMQRHRHAAPPGECAHMRSELRTIHRSEHTRRRLEHHAPPLSRRRLDDGFPRFRIPYIEGKLLIHPQRSLHTKKQRTSESLRSRVRCGYLVLL